MKGRELGTQRRTWGHITGNIPGLGLGQLLFPARGTSIAILFKFQYSERHEEKSHQLRQVYEGRGCLLGGGWAVLPQRLPRTGTPRTGHRGTVLAR